MADNIATSSNGQAMIASLRETPWHNKGTVFKEEVDSKQMRKLAHLDWDVLEAPVYANTGILANNVLDNITPKQILGLKTVYRSDTGMPLGIVGEDYKVFQNESVFDLFDQLASGHKIQYEVAGGLGNGETVWCLARIPDLKLDVGGDELNSYMLISTGHIGNRTLTVYPTSIRVVCQNTIRMADSKFRENRRNSRNKNNVHTGYAIKHTAGMQKAIDGVAKAYAALLNDFTLTKEMFEAMMNTPVNTEMKNRFFDFIIDPTKDESEKAKELSKRGETMRANKKESLEKLFESPTNQTKASKNTVWGLYNTVIEFVDYGRGTRCADGKDESDCKFESAMFGSGSTLKDIAFTQAMELIA